MLHLYSALEGISYLWLQNPEALNEGKDCKEIFGVVFQRFKQKSLTAATKSRIVRTFINFLDLFSHKMQMEVDKDISLMLGMIEKELASFVVMLDSPEHAVRQAVGELIGKINDLGLIPVREAAGMFIKMLNDCNALSSNLANS
jgi:hypothetical protein